MPGVSVIYQLKFSRIIKKAVIEPHKTLRNVL